MTYCAAAWRSARMIAYPRNGSGILRAGRLALDLLATVTRCPSIYSAHDLPLSIAHDATGHAP